MALTKVSTGVVDMSTSTGGLVIAKGTEIQRPASPSIGMIRESTQTIPSKVEVYTDNGGAPDWQFLEEAGPSFIPLTVDYLIVAGGGGGARSAFTTGGAYGGGGGAGEFLYKTSQTLTTGSPGYSVIVGAGSLAQIGGAGYPDFAPNGGDSTFNLDVTNGGAGGANSAAYNPGASGGSGSGGVLQRQGGTSVKTAGGLGNNGGYGSLTASGYGAGGGGGALTVGANGGGTVGGNGGDGETNSITGTPVVYSAGGGGGRYLGNNAQGGSSGIGGNPTSGTPTTPTNYGCGGAGGSYASGIAQQGGNASNGVVILRYPAGSTASSTLTYSDTIVPGSTDRVIVITGTGTVSYTHLTLPTKRIV